MIDQTVIVINPITKTRKIKISLKTMKKLAPVLLEIKETTPI
jgi:hypothetical protein